MDAFDKGMAVIVTVACTIAGCGIGKDLARDFMVKEAQRCLEAPDIDTARVCWDAATLGWQP